MSEPTDESNKTSQINTSGGSYIESGVEADEFVGRNKHVLGDEVHGDKVMGDQTTTSVNNFFLGIPKYLIVIIGGSFFILVISNLTITVFTAGIFRVAIVPPTPTFTPIPTATPSPIQCGIRAISMMRKEPETGSGVIIILPGEIVVIKAIHVRRLSSNTFSTWFQVELNRDGKVYEGFITSYPLNPCVLSMR